RHYSLTVSPQVQNRFSLSREDIVDFLQDAYQLDQDEHRAGCLESTLLNVFENLLAARAVSRMILDCVNDYVCVDVDHENSSRVSLTSFTASRSSFTCD